jgi:S1-C subfamily serine protease
MKDTYYEERHNKIARPCVRIRAQQAGGSGTVLWAGEDTAYVLTNHHVVSGAIRVEKRWNSLLKRDIKSDIFDEVEVHLFKYKYNSRTIGGTSIQSEIVAYDEDEDLALLKMQGVDTEMRCAQLYPRNKEKELMAGMPVIAVGAGLGEPPVQTEGILSQFGQLIERREFWLHTASTIFGNSGGALFLGDTFQFIGVPARIAIAMFGFSADAITHLSFAIPITRVYNFLDKQYFRFIYNDSFTEESEAEERKEAQEAELYKLKAAEDKGKEIE